MEPIAVRPEKAQKTLWLINWTIVFALVLLPMLILALALEQPANLVFGLCAAGCLIIMLAVLAWIGAFYRSLEYVINADAVRAKKGVFWRRHVTVPYTKVTNIDVTQGPLERAFGVGRVHVQTAGASGPQTPQSELRMVGIRNFEQLKDTMMERISGYRGPAPAAETERAPQGEAEGLLRRILDQLTAIRRTLGDQ